MTYDALYDLERREMLDVPVIGVAIDEMSIDDLRARARESVEAAEESVDDAVFDSLAKRLSYIQGDYKDPKTFEAVESALGGAKSPGLLPGDPAVSVLDGRQGPPRRRSHRGRAGRDREALRPRPRLGGRTQRRARRAARRGPDLPDRPLPRQGARDGHPLPALRQHDARADLEPPLRALGHDHDGRALRRRGPRQLLRPGRRAARRRPEPPAPAARADRDGAAVRRPRP